MAAHRKDGMPSKKSPGKPQGAVTVMARRRTARLACGLEATGETALDVMVDNMLFWHRAGKQLGERIEDLLDGASAKGEGLDNETAKELNGLLKNFTFARDRSQACAEGAAQYMHPKLAAIQVKKEETKRVITMTLENAAKGEDRSYRNLPGADQHLKSATSPDSASGNDGVQEAVAVP